MHIVRFATLTAALMFVACGAADGADPSADSAASVESPLASPARLAAPYPIVLLHGMAGFDQVTSPVTIHYWNGVLDRLAADGEGEVFVTTTAPFGSSEERAKILAPQIEAILTKTGKGKVNLVGHSQGGLDARFLASPGGLAMGDRIASVTTIATPHRGSRVADLVLGLLRGVPAAIVDSVSAAVLRILQRSIYDVAGDPDLRAQLVQLSEVYMAQTFNPRVVDDPRVAYFSYAGRTNFQSGARDCAGVYADDASLRSVAQAMVYATAVFLQGTTNVTNDGLVTVASSRWGTFLQCVPADHMREVGHLTGIDPLSRFDHLKFFVSVVARIRGAGY